MSSKASTLHKWEVGYQAPDVLGAPCPVARIVVTSIPEDPPPWFLVANPGRIRKEFVDETIEMLFGRQSNGQSHTWEQLPMELKGKAEYAAR